MASTRKRSAPSSRKKRRLPWILVAVAILVVAGAFVVVGNHVWDDSANAPAVAAFQPEVTPQQTLSQKHLYSQTADPSQEISQALSKAKLENKRVIVDFGGDWCGDCQVLDYYMHQPANVGLLDSNFVVVHVYAGENGRLDKNLDLAAKYDVPLAKGVPALAVLDAEGKLLYSQRDREFEKMSTMDPASVNEFLNRWKA